MTDSPRVAVWNCKGCGVVHLSLDGVVVDLSREEFRELASSVVETSYEMANVIFSDLPIKLSNDLLH